MKNVAKYEKIVDKEVLECYYNICKYYKVDTTIISNFLMEII